MSPPDRAVSVVIPTHNRRASLARLLAGLSRQTLDAGRFEVIVAANGCSDGTVAEVGREPLPFAVQVVTLPGRGAAAARNAGARPARAPLLLFLDDDMDPAPGLVEAHVRAHEANPGGVVIGPALPPWRGPASFFRMALRQWWMDQFQAMGAAGHRFTFRDLLSGNVSLAAELFHRVGGFDSTLRCREDYELGARLIAARVAFGFAPGAVARHHDQTDLDRSLDRVRAEGRADVGLGARHPDLRPVLQATWAERPGGWGGLLMRLALHRPGIGDRLAGGMRMMLPLLERARFRSVWCRIYGAVRGYWYWRGVGDAQHDSGVAPAAVHRAGRPDAPAPVVLDLAEGLAAAERHLDRLRPAGAELWHGPYRIGRIAAEPGAEALRGTHLRPLLARPLASQYLVALALAGATGPGAAPDPREVVDTTVAA